MRRTRRTISTLALSAGLTLSACGDKGGAPTPNGEQPTGQAAQQSAQKKATGGQSVYSRAALTAAIPKDAPVVFVTTDFTEIAKVLGREGLIKAFPVEYGEIRKEMNQIYGDRDILDPAAWAEMGLDASKPMGLAILQTEPEAIAAYVHVSDQAKFDAFVGPILTKAGAAPSTAGDKIRPMNSADDQYNQSYLIRKDDLAITLYTRLKGDEGKAMAEKIAGLKQGDALTSRPEIGEAFDALAYGQQGAVWVDIVGLMDSATRPRKSYAVQVAEADLEAAEASKDEGRIAEAKANLAEEKSWSERRQKRQAKEMELIKLAFKGLKGFAMGVTADGPTLGFKASLEMEPTSPLKAIFKKGEGVPMMVKALDTKPTLLSTGNIDAAALERYIDQLVTAAGEGVTLAMAKGMIQAQLGVDVNALIKQIQGEMGFAMTVDQSKLKGEETPQAFGGAFLMRLTDPKGMTTTLNTLMARPELKSMVKATGEGMWEIPVPNYKTIYLGVVGDYVAVAPEKAFLDRVKAGDDSKSFTKGLTHAGLKATLTTPDAGQVFINDSMFLGYMMMASFGGYWDRPTPYMANPTPEYEAKKKEYEATSAALKAQREKDTEAVNAEMLKIMKLVGTQAGYATPNDRGVLIAGGQFLGGESVTSTILEVAKAAKGIDEMERAQRSARSALQTKADALYDELTTRKPILGPGSK